MAEKKFVIKHVFENLVNIESCDSRLGNKEGHFDVLWFLVAYHEENTWFSLECPPLDRNPEQRIECQIESKIRKKNGEFEECVQDHVFEGFDNIYEIKEVMENGLDEYIFNGNVEIECHVTIKEMEGVRECPRRFDESVKAFSDVVVVVGEQKFYLNRMYLASHSTYFNALFFGNFDESQKSEIELKDIDPWAFQNFLELIHGVTLVDDDSVVEILKLSDMYDTTSAKERCEWYLLSDKSELSRREIFYLANEYKLEKLMETCLAKIDSADEIRHVLPDDLQEMDKTVMAQLLQKALSYCENKNND